MTNRIKISEFDVKTAVTNSEYVVVVEDGQNYLLPITSIPQIADIYNVLDSMQAQIDTKLSAVANGIIMDDASSQMIADHSNAYLSFIFEGAKTYQVMLADGFPEWGIVTLRNSADAGDLIVTAELGVTLDGNQDALIVLPKASLQLIKASENTWHIL